MVNSVGPIGVNPTLLASLNYNPITDLVPIVQIADVPNVLVVHPSLPVKDFDEFIAYGKANPSKLNYASTGVGTSAHLSVLHPRQARRYRGHARSLQRCRGAA